MNNTVYGECAVHKGENMVGCPQCKFEDALNTKITLVLKKGDNLIELHPDGGEKVIKKLQKHDKILPKEFMINDTPILVEKILNILYSHRFPLVVEKETQFSIEEKFSENGIEYSREHRLDEKNIPDFFIDGIAIEVKIKGNAKSIYRQCERYCKFDEVKKIILVTNRSMGFPKEINGKDCYFINLGKAWL